MTLPPALTRPLQWRAMDTFTWLGRHTKHQAPLGRLRVPRFLEHHRQHIHSRSRAADTVVEDLGEQEGDFGLKTIPRTSRKGARWSSELDELVVKLRTANKTWEYISLMTGRPVSACSDRFYTALDPTLRNWTPAMFAKLDQMVGEGARWSEIGTALNATTVTCQHQWRMLGKGKYRVTSTMGGVKVVDWSPYEINTFWTAWLKHGTNWKAISAEIYFRTPSECRDAFKTLTTNAIKDAPGWLRIEVSKYVTATLRNARSTKQLETDDTIADSSSQKRTQWTAAEHEALLKSVEKHGLFSGWDNIRSLVKPELTNDEVEAEYYSLTGVNLGGDSDGNVTVEPMNSEWTADQVKRLNIVLMRYCTLPVWIGEAAKHGVETRDNDPETIFALFQGTSESQTEETGGNNQPAPRDSMGMSPPVWTKECIVRLKRMVRQQQQQERASGQPVNWSWVAEHIGPGFDASACITKWQDMPAKSKERLGPSTYWDDDDIEQLRKGMAAYGRGWSLIHRAYLPRRSTDSIRRKVENIKKARVDLVRETKKTAKFMQASDSSLDVEEFVHRTLKDNPVYVLSKELDDLCLRSSHSKSKNFETTSGVEGPSSPSPASRIEDEGDKEVAASVDAPSASRPQPGSPNESPAINKPQSVSASLYRLRGRPKRVSMPSDSSLP